jgi:hypothetical protein
MIELDRFVFGYISENQRKKHESEMLRVGGYDALYFLASLYGSRALVKADYKPDFEAMISRHI